MNSIHDSGSNIFANIGLPDADSHFLKAQIAAELYRIVTEQKLTQAKVGERMGISQPEVSRLFKGNFREYSVERLMNLLTAFSEVRIVAEPLKNRNQRGHISFSATIPARVASR